MSCHPMFLFVYFSLLLMTAGFVLTLCSWLAPPLNNIVHGVRIFGLVALLVGSLMLLSSCVVGALNHGRCFSFCYMFGDNKSRKKSASSTYTPGVIENPLVETSNKAKTSNHLKRCRSSGRACIPLQDHSAQEKLFSGEKANYGSCERNVEPSQSPIRKAILVLRNDTPVSDKWGSERDSQSHDSHVAPCLEQSKMESKSSRDDSSYNAGQFRILKAYRREEPPYNDFDTLDVRSQSFSSNRGNDHVYTEEVTTDHHMEDTVMQHGHFSTEDDFVQTFMSG